jgi:hypothetical protein
MADELNFLPDETLLMTFIAGEATPAEAMLVNQWIATSPSHFNTYEQLTRLWLATEGYRAPQDGNEIGPTH